METYHNRIEVPRPLPSGSYDGSMEAHTYEVAEPGVRATSRLIRTDQDWGVEVHWEMHGEEAHWFPGVFHLRTFLESIGPGPEYAIPALADPAVEKGTLDGTWYPADKQRLYSQNIEIKANTINPGTYKVVTLLQLCAQDGRKLPIAGMVEGPILDIFETKP